MKGMLAKSSIINFLQTNPHFKNEGENSKTRIVLIYIVNFDVQKHSQFGEVINSKMLLYIFQRQNQNRWYLVLPPHSISILLITFRPMGRNEKRKNALALKVKYFAQLDELKYRSK